MYAVVFFHALRVKIRDEATVRSKAIYLALAMLPDGHRDILGLWIEQTEGATFWMKVFSDLKTRGCQDILIAVTDGLKGMSEALDAFERGPWGTKFPTVVASWRRAWTQIIPFFAFPPDIRRLMYTTNALESVHAQLRKIIKTRGHFPNDEAATKLIWLALRKHHGQVGAHVAPLARRDEPIRDSVRRSLSTLIRVECRSAWTLHRFRSEEERKNKSTSRQPALHTKFQTVPPIPGDRVQMDTYPLNLHLEPIP
jgi:transposase-like protein